MSIPWREIAIVFISAFAGAWFTRRFDTSHERLMTRNAAIYELMQVYSWLYCFSKKEQIGRKLSGQVSSNTMSRSIKEKAMQDLRTLLMNDRLWGDMARFDPFGVLELKTCVDGIMQNMHTDVLKKESLRQGADTTAFEKMMGSIQSQILEQLLPKLREKIIRISKDISLKTNLDKETRKTLAEFECSLG